MSARNDYTHFLNVFNVDACVALMYCWRDFDPV